MRNGEIKNYKGRRITKVNSKCWSVSGYVIYFDTYYAAKQAIDDDDAEDEALARIDTYVRDVLGGYM